MTLDYQQVSEQVRQLGETAVKQHQEQKTRLELARGMLAEHAEQVGELRARVEAIVGVHDPALRCALPVSEALNACLPLPEIPPSATILAADGSQINPDRHEQVEYALVNVGAIRLQLGRSLPPETTITSHLIYQEDIAEMSEGMLALARDLSERAKLAELAAQSQPPVVSFTDGPMELWGAKAGGGGAEASAYQHSLLEYLQVLGRLHDLDVITAGYVEKPGANLVVRLLEVCMVSPDEWPKIREHPPLRGVTDRALFMPLLEPGARSAVFALQSQSSKSYAGALALHFFYLNVGRERHSHLARVEVPAWVANDEAKLKLLHAVLIQQCQMMGSRPYPYLLHRAHETALVSLQEKEQVTQMIVLELNKRGITLEERSYKQSAKDLTGRTRYRV